ncbi:MAG TPA: galactose-1-phosphate uridylyltransferase [Methanolinea sp.]|nr:galactose-1-phosphate uridylyltransferase [Methanolinea sp.]HQK55751.1 galactose-1-phosphate uridylyltransferase [Methanolinea sp.]
MFRITRVRSGDSSIEYREEHVSGLRCRIAPGRLNRRLDVVYSPPEQTSPCPFCTSRVEETTPCFPGGTRIVRGESLTFPNLFPYAKWHTVTVITRAHHVDAFTPGQIGDAFEGMIESLAGQPGFPSINWNYLSSAGASIVHPHLQGLADPVPPALLERYLRGSASYLRRHGRSYWDDLVKEERSGPRFLFGDEICWLAQAVPLGEREVRAILPISSMPDFEPYLATFVEGLLSVLSMYRSLGTHAFNMSLFFDRPGSRRGFSAFCSLISRMNPNVSSTSDSAFMERLHQEPVILTLPEELASYFTESRT